jgi:hypothetical protein
VSTLRFALTGIVVALLLCAAQSPACAAASRGLWDHNYVATHVTGDGADGKLFSDPGVIGVTLSRSRRHGERIGFQANCNGYGARIHLRGGKLHLGEATSSDEWCSGVAGRQDSWLWTFFDSVPSWRLRGRLLAIWGGGRAMVLRQK